MPGCGAPCIYDTLHDSSESAGCSHNAIKSDERVVADDQNR